MIAALFPLLAIQAARATNPMIPLLIQMGAIFAIFYFLMIRPQQQRQKQLDKMLKALKKGDRVLTTGGIFGTVIGLDDQKAVLRIADDTKVEFSRTSIVQVMATEAK